MFLMSSLVCGLLMICFVIICVVMLRVWCGWVLVMCDWKLVSILLLLM